MQKLAFILASLLFLPVVGADGQGVYRPLVSRPGEVPVIDMLNLPGENVFDVVRHPESSFNFSSAVLTGFRPGEILAAYIRTDSVRSIGMSRSLDGGRNWTHEPFANRWDGEKFRSLSLFNLGQPHFDAGNGRKRHPAQGKNNLVLFSGGNPILISSSYTNGERWCNFYPLNNFGGFRISGLVQLRDGRHMALFHDDGRFLYQPEEGTVPLRKSAIYKTYSSDGGLTWSRPELALKHNIHGLYDAVVIYSPARKDNDLILIASQRETSAAYIAFSSDDGNTWSYPEKLPSFIQGDRFGIATVGHNLVIVFRDMARTLRDGSPNPTYGDLVLWSGDLHKLMHENSFGIKIRVADNYPTKEAVDYNDRQFYDCGYASVLPVSRKLISIVAYGRWEADSPPFIRSFILHPGELRQYFNQISR